jgi:hypothetical protein
LKHEGRRAAARAPILDEQTEDGWRFPDGEFIPAGYETLSPDGNIYRCRKPKMPSHCLFVTKARG